MWNTLFNVEFCSIVRRKGKAQQKSLSLSHTQSHSVCVCVCCGDCIFGFFALSVVNERLGEDLGGMVGVGIMGNM